MISSNESDSTEVFLKNLKVFPDRGGISVRSRRAEHVYLDPLGVATLARKVRPAADTARKAILLEKRLFRFKVVVRRSGKPYLFSLFSMADFLIFMNFRSSWRRCTVCVRLLGFVASCPSLLVLTELHCVRLVKAFS